VFLYQLRTMAVAGDVLVTISASGNSENIVRAVEWARGNGVGTIAMTGFSGGRSAPLADINLHVDAQNYGIAEDVHQGLMHCLAQHLRQQAMPAELVAKRVF
jgi:D-sedoheptulose 7-phosphate isomerase